MKNSVYRWILNVAGKEKNGVILLTAVQALSGYLGVHYAILLRGAVDAVSQSDRILFRSFLLRIIMLLVVQTALRFLIRWLSELIRSGLENNYKKRMMYIILNSDCLGVSSVHSGEWINRLTNDTTVVANGITDIIPDFTGLLVKLVSALAIVISMAPVFAAVLLPAGIVLVFFTFVFRQNMKELHKRVQTEDGKLRIIFQDSISNLLMITSFSAEQVMLEKVTKQMENHQSVRMTRTNFANVCNLGFRVLMNAIIIIGLSWGGFGILNGTVSVGALIAMTQLITQIQTPLAYLTGYIPRYFAVIASAERLMEAEIDYREKNPSKSLEEIIRFYNDGLKNIGFEGVEFSYPGLEDSGLLFPGQLSFEVNKGDFVAVTGPSGCGKSTMLKLLMCAYNPDKGERYYTDISGSKRELTSLDRRLFAYVPQGNALMTGTIREAVCFAEPEALNDEDRIKESLKIACADGFVSELENGIDYKMGERGEGLSEGQIQRLSIARAIFSKSPILLLDEATSALDLDTEQQFLSNLKKMTDKTVIIVTHRVKALDLCNKTIEFTKDGIRVNDC